MLAAIEARCQPTAPGTRWSQIPFKSTTRAALYPLVKLVRAALVRKEPGGQRPSANGRRPPERGHTAPPLQQTHGGGQLRPDAPLSRIPRPAESRRLRRGPRDALPEPARELPARGGLHQEWPDPPKTGTARQPSGDISLVRLGLRHFQSPGALRNRKTASTL